MSERVGVSLCDFSYIVFYFSVFFLLFSFCGVKQPQLKKGAIARKVSAGGGGTAGCRLPAGALDVLTT